MVWPVQSNIYHNFESKGLKFLTCLRLGLGHLNEHRFWHNIQDCINILCSCRLEIGDISHLHSHRFPTNALGKDTLWNFSFRVFHEIYFQGHFMKHETWNNFTLIFKFHCIPFSSIKKCVYRANTHLLKFNSNK